MRSFAQTLIATCLAATGLSAPAPAQDASVITIATGGVTGVYYPAGGGICRFVNRDRLDHGVRCAVVSSGGSLDNIAALRADTADFGVAQTDAAWNAANAEADFARQPPFDTLRAVFALHPEPFTLVARPDAGIGGLSDLPGKRVNIGNPGSGQRATMEVVMAAMGWTTADFAAATELPSGEQTQALCDGEIDAMVFAVGHPSASVQEATSACGAVLVNVTGAEIDALVADNPYYLAATIPGGLYRNNPDDIRTFGVGAVLVTTAEQPDDLVYLVTKSVFGNLDQFRGLHPAFGALDARTMATQGLVVPLHPGAERYFREAGLTD
jgi:TRAP transporter TAXI family solute receptor